MLLLRFRPTTSNRRPDRAPVWYFTRRRLPIGPKNADSSRSAGQRGYPAGLAAQPGRRAVYLPASFCSLSSSPERANRFHGGYRASSPSQAGAQRLSGHLIGDADHRRAWLCCRLPPARLAQLCRAVRGAGHNAVESSGRAELPAGALVWPPDDSILIYCTARFSSALEHFAGRPERRDRARHGHWRRLFRRRAVFDATGDAFRPRFAVDARPDPVDAHGIGEHCIGCGRLRRNDNAIRLSGAAGFHRGDAELLGGRSDWRHGCHALRAGCVVAQAHRANITRSGPAIRRHRRRAGAGFRLP